MSESTTIQKNPLLSAASDYELLRKKGLEYIEQLSSSIWTDYNIHDPGITMLELLSYAITDLGYRSTLNIKDLLAEPPSKNPKELPARQGFYTAREILTVNPWTDADYRKLLVDINGIKNAWLKCKECACNDLLIYAKCSTSKLQYEPTEHPIVIKGFYDVLVEFETEAGSGDLNSGKINYNFLFTVSGGISNAVIEMRLPSWQQLQDDLTLYKKLRSPKCKVEKVTVSFISGNKNDNLDMPAAQMVNVLRRPVYATIKVDIKPDISLPAVETITYTDVPMTVWFKTDADRKQIQLIDIKKAIEDASTSGIFGKYLYLIQRADEVMKITNDQLHQHRNLSEDYCSIKAIPVQDVGVCADIDAEPWADIEAILAEAYYRIDQYLSPDIKFYSLKELMEAGVPVDEIFDGPKLNNGFINNGQLESTNLKQFIYTSDIINLLMDIPGIRNIRNFTLTRFDADGKLIESKEWVMQVNYNHQPRLYLEASKILVFKNGLPFLPDKTELSDTLQVIKGKHAQPQFSVLENDLPVPQGSYYRLNEYYPVQYTFPFTYGVSYDGLPATASPARKAQAKQLKGYLLFYEQILVNYLEQLANVKELFALDTSVKQTYFTRLLTDADIKALHEIQNTLTQNELHSLAEPGTVFLDRRNRFLDHMLSRFAENFNEYALMLYSYSTSKAVADAKLIHDKISFLIDVPWMSTNRAKAIHYKNPSLVCTGNNMAGLELRIKRLLGMNVLGGFFELFDVLNANGVAIERRWRLRDYKDVVHLVSVSDFISKELPEAEQLAMAEVEKIKQYILNISNYKISNNGQWSIQLQDGAANGLANHPATYAAQTDAEAARDAIILFGTSLLAADKVYVVEHLLLRPRFTPLQVPGGDPLLTVCIPDNCELCGEEDPYSFRLTVVLSGQSGIANSGIEFRRFAETTIRKEVPAHLALKICWVSDEQLLRFEKLYCDWLSELAKEEPVMLTLHEKLTLLLAEFKELKSVYPEARLHDCIDGDDSNRVFLDNTII